MFQNFSILSQKVINICTLLCAEKKNIANKALNSPTTTPKLIEEDNPTWRKPLLRENDFELPDSKSGSEPNSEYNLKKVF